MRPSFSFCVSATLENLAAVRSLVEEAATALEIAPAAIADVVLAVDEAASNIVVHGYQGQPGTIEIEVKRENDALLVCLRDAASPFDSTRVPAPDMTVPLEQRASGGLGIFLMRQLIDEVTHRTTSQGGNELVLVKSLEGGEP